MSRVLGFDISSANIGYCVMDYDENSKVIIESGLIKPPKDKNIIKRLVETKKLVVNLIEKFSPDDIAIEDILLFVKGKSTAKTIITLASFNRMVGLAAWEYLAGRVQGHEPRMISVATVRSRVRLDDGTEAPKKEDIPSLLEKHLSIKFPWILNRKNEIHKSSYDKSDAMAIALTFVILKYQPIKPKKKKVK